MASRSMQRLIFTGVVFGAQGVGGADMRSIQRLTKQPSEIFGLAQFNQSPERSIGIGGCRVDQEAGLVLRSIHLRVYPFPDTGSVVPTFEGQLSDQQMR